MPKDTQHGQILAKSTIQEDPRETVSWTKVSHQTSRHQGLTMVGAMAYGLPNVLTEVTLVPRS